MQNHELAINEVVTGKFNNSFSSFIKRKSVYMTKIELVAYDLWNRNDVEYIEIKDPSLEQLYEIIFKLDGLNTTEVSIYTQEKSICLCIGGGNAKLYNVYYSEHYGEDNYTLTKEKSITGKVHPLITGGQISDFEDEICVDIHMVRSVVEYFYQTGEMKKEYIWHLE